MNLLMRLLATALVKFGRLVVWCYYSPVRIVGRDRLPADGPLLLVANHANSLIDPVLVGLTTRRRVSFLAKAPLFDVPVFGPFLSWLGMIPVHRAKDDPRQTKRSLISLSKAAEALAAGQAVGIFPEGKTHDARALAEVMGGTARLIQQAQDAGARSLKVVPVGINYDNKRLFRSAVWIEVGPPLDVTTLVAGTDSAAAARHTLTREIATRLREVVIHLDDPAMEPVLEDLELLDPALAAPGGKRIFSLQQRKSVADALNHFRKTRPNTVASIRRALVSHRAHLQANGLCMSADILQGARWRSRLLRIWHSARLACGLLPVVCGILQNIIPMLLSRMIVACIPQAGATTVALSRLGVAVPVFALWYAFTWWLLVGYFLPWVAWFWVLVTPFAGLFSLRYCRTLVSVTGAWWADLRMLFRHTELVRLRAAQARLRARVGRLSAVYAVERPPLPQKPGRLFERPSVRFGILTGLLLIAAGGFAICALQAGLRNATLDVLVQPAPDYRLVTAADLEQQLQADEQHLSRVLAALDALEADMVRLQAGFASGQNTFFNDADNDLISQQVLVYLNCRQELLSLILRYRAHHTITDDQLRLRASQLDLAAGCTLYQFASRWTAAFAKHPNARRKLNEGEPSWGIPAGIYDKIVANLNDERNLAPLRAALKQYQAATAANTAAGLTETPPHAVFHRLITGTVVTAPSGGFFQRLAHEADELRSAAIYRGQSTISRAIGSTRIRERKEGPRVRPDQLEKIRSQLRPGDILIERQDWFLSRAFMPGYWAHAALYIGTPDEVAAMGLADHPWVAPHWEEFKRRSADGHLHAIIEAVPEGVRFTTLEHCLGVADSAAVLRPVLTTPEERKDAIARACHHLGKEYDFEFDFFSADKLVCTELVTRAYANADASHLGFPLVNVMGRKTLPPTEMARKFAHDRLRPDRQLGLVIFLDGHARGQQAAERDEEAFADTINRPGMTWFRSAE